MGENVTRSWCLSLKFPSLRKNARPGQWLEPKVCRLGPRSGHTPRCGFDPRAGHIRRQSNDTSLTLAVPLLLSLTSGKAPSVRRRSQQPVSAAQAVHTELPLRPRELPGPRGRSRSNRTDHRPARPGASSPVHADPGGPKRCPRGSRRSCPPGGHSLPTALPGDPPETPCPSLEPRVRGSRRPCPTRCRHLALLSHGHVCHGQIWPLDPQQPRSRGSSADAAASPPSAGRLLRLCGSAARAAAHGLPPALAERPVLPCTPSPCGPSTSHGHRTGQRTWSGRPITDRSPRQTCCARSPSSLPTSGAREIEAVWDTPAHRHTCGVSGTHTCTQS